MFVLFVVGWFFVCDCVLFVEIWVFFELILFLCLLSGFGCCLVFCFYVVLWSVLGVFVLGWCGVVCVVDSGVCVSFFV